MVLFTSSSKRNLRGFAVAEVLIVAVIITMIGGFAFVQFQKREIKIGRSNAAEQLSISLANARLDSMRRGATTPDQFAGVTILDPVTYKVSEDSNSDGRLDPSPTVILPNSGLRFSGPFPNTIMFDRLGRPVDTDGHIIEYPILSVIDASGPTFIKFANSGKPFLSDNPKY